MDPANHVLLKTQTTMQHHEIPIISLQLARRDPRCWGLTIRTSPTTSSGLFSPLAFFSLRIRTDIIQSQTQRNFESPLTITPGCSLDPTFNFSKGTYHIDSWHTNDKMVQMEDLDNRGQVEKMRQILERGSGRFGLFPPQVMKHRSTSSLGRNDWQSVNSGLKGCARQIQDMLDVRNPSLRPSLRSSSSWSTGSSRPLTPDTEITEPARSPFPQDRYKTDMSDSGVCVKTPATTPDDPFNSYTVKPTTENRVLDELEDQFENIQRKARLLQNQLDECTRQVDLLKDRVLTLEEENLELRAAGREGAELRKKLRAEIEDLRRQLQEARCREDALRNELDEAREVERSLRRQLADAQEEIYQQRRESAMREMELVDQLRRAQAEAQERTSRQGTPVSVQQPEPPQHHVLFPPEPDYWERGSIQATARIQIFQDRDERDADLIHAQRLENEAQRRENEMLLRENRALQDGLWRSSRRSRRRESPVGWVRSSRNRSKL